MSPPTARADRAPDGRRAAHRIHVEVVEERRGDGHADIAAGLCRRGPWGERRDGYGRHAAGPRGNHGRPHRLVFVMRILLCLRSARPRRESVQTGFTAMGARGGGQGRRPGRPRIFETGERDTTRSAGAGLAAARKAAALEVARPVRSLRHGTPASSRTHTTVTGLGADGAAATVLRPRGHGGLAGANCCRWRASCTGGTGRDAHRGGERGAGGGSLKRGDMLATAKGSAVVARQSRPRPGAAGFSPRQAPDHGTRGGQRCEVLAGGPARIVVVDHSGHVARFARDDGRRCSGSSTIRRSRRHDRESRRSDA